MKQAKGVQWLYAQLPELIRRGVLSEETASGLRAHYGDAGSGSRMRVALAVFGVIGAVCVGLGVILLFAHNWDMFTRFQRTLLAFTPLVLSQAVIAFVIWTRRSSLAAAEGGAVFNMLATGGAIALISQIYHMPGDIDGFLLTWMLLTIPVVYLLDATLIGILYLVGITTWAGFAQVQGGTAVLYWPLAGLLVPHYLKHWRMDRYSSRIVWLSSAFCVSLTVGIGFALEKTLPGLWILVYSAFFTVLYLVSKFWFSEALSNWQRPVRRYALLGMVILPYMFSYEWVWRSIGWNYYRSGNQFVGWAGFADYAVLVALLYLLVHLFMRAFGQLNRMEIAFGALPFLALAVFVLANVGADEAVCAWIFSLYVLSLGVLTMLSGFKDNLLGLANVGILMIGVIVFTRFVDPSLGILVRAMIFMVIGAVFLGANVFLAGRMAKEAS